VSAIGPLSRIAFHDTPAVADGTTDALPQVRVQQLTSNNAQARGTVTVALTGGPAGATLSGTLMRSGTGVLTFDDLRINRVGQGYRLVISAAGVASVTSNPFNVG